MIHNPKHPCSLVWTPLPLLTWIFPLIGHMGITDETGVVHDFIGHGYINVGALSFGRPTLFVPLYASHVAHPPTSSRLELVKRMCHRPLPTAMEEAVYTAHMGSASTIYQTERYNILLNNCHSYVATCLNKMHLLGFNQWKAMDVWLLFIMQFHFISISRTLQTFLPFLIICTLVIVCTCL